MELSFAKQSIAFLYSIPFGAAIGTIYGVLKIIRIAFSLKKGAVIALDIIFMLFCSLCVFFYSLGMLDGYIRIYVILGAMLGFFIYRLTVGKILQRILNPIILAVIKIIAAILTKIKIFAKKLLKIGYDILYNIRGRIVSYKKTKSTNKHKNNKRIEYGRKRKRKESAGAERRA